MLKWICAVALAATVASPALAQKPADRPAKQTKPFDQGPMKEGMAIVRQGGECIVTYVVSKEGKAKDIKPDCTVPEMAPYVARTVETAEWTPEIFDGEIFDTEPIKQIFKFAGGGSAPAADPRGEKAPVAVKDLEPKDIERAINRVDKEGTCEVKYTVGADGVPKDIQPNCSEPALNSHIAEAIAKMRYEPGQKGGQPVDWPGMSMPMNLTKPKG
ncbi:MAG TPA: hypothetical protein VFV70_04580 [Hyphomonadaceae bacterium]|nr:hypothetical protein [Hyphomonadaceae bacterium]